MNQKSPESIFVEVHSQNQNLPHPSEGIQIVWNDIKVFASDSRSTSLAAEFFKRMQEL